MTSSFTGAVPAVPSAPAQTSTMPIPGAVGDGWPVRPHVTLLMADGVFRDQFGPEERARLRELAHVPGVMQYDNWTDPAAREVLADSDVVISSWGCPELSADFLEAAPRLRAVFHAAGTVRHMVTDALWERNILVTTSADVNAVPVAEFTLAAIVMAGKKAPFLAAAARTGRTDWRGFRTAFGPMTNLCRTIGIIGFSKVGRRVVAGLQSLRMSALVYDPHVEPDAIRAAGAEPADLEEVLRRSDVVSVHAPELPSTRHMLGAEQLALIGDRATVINTARGSLIDTAALERECASGRLNAMLDVTDPEPLPAGSVLYDLPNAMITPHVAGSLGNEVVQMATSALTELERYTQGLPPLAPVTRKALEDMA